ncbi:MAG: DUF6529 family protein, partial [Actinomycetota bacterium]|nr:DUF6529 family protein [Actinomycetota bacterium]
MDDLVQNLTFGRVTEVKIVLTSVATALAGYQVLLMAVGYGKLRLPFLAPGPASRAHRAIGDTIVTITLLVAVMCIAFFEVADGIEHAYPGEQDRVRIHVIGGFSLLGVLALKIAVIRWWHALGRLLPVLGLTVFGLFVVMWLSS